MKIIAALLVMTVLCAIGGEARKGKGRGGMQQSYGGGGGQQSYGGGQQHSSGASPMQHRAPMQGKSKGKGQQQPMSHGRPAARPMMSPSYGNSGSSAPQQMSGSYGSSAASMVMPAQHAKPSAQSSYGGGNTGAMAPPKASKGGPAPMSSSY